MTPPAVASRLVGSIPDSNVDTALEPSFGDGAFLLPLVERAVRAETSGTTNQKLGRVLTERVWGVEVDPALYEVALRKIRDRWSPLPREHNLTMGDYFRFEPAFQRFDLIVGNPPFGGTFDAEIEDALDRRFGWYKGDKLKKETYSFFIAKAIEELAHGGTLKFICSDTFLTIKTMKGLRRLLIDRGRCSVERLSDFSEETLQPMVVLSVQSDGPAGHAEVFGAAVSRAAMGRTQNFSWTISESLAEYFDGPTVGDFMVATGGMTIGKNEWFLREVAGGTIEEPFDLVFFDEPITVEGERRRARLHKLEAKLQAAEASGETRRSVRAEPRRHPLRVELPHSDYRPYNKSSGERLFVPPSSYVYWRDDGDAVLTFKKSGPWYLHGVGGAPYFGREGLTWQLVASKIKARYLPSGYILDSGAPCAFLRPGVARDELYFLLGWLQTDLATGILKSVINHTRNIQGKDVERLPYPHWVASSDRSEIVRVVESAVAALIRGEPVDVQAATRWLEDRFKRVEAVGLRSDSGRTSCGWSNESQVSGEIIQGVPIDSWLHQIRDASRRIPDTGIPSVGRIGITD